MISVKAARRFISWSATKADWYWYFATTSTQAAILGPYFFLSSRRRHTRLVSDWSSDVCSSDLNSL